MACYDVFDANPTPEIGITLPEIISTEGIKEKWPLFSDRLDVWNSLYMENAA